MKSISLGILLGIVSVSLIQRPVDGQAVAVDTAKWIRTSRLETTFGITWPADPRDPKTVSTALNHGSPGVILFLLELGQATGDRAYLDDAKRGADELMTKVNTETRMGLYDGVAGMGFAFGETWRATKDERFHRDVLNVVKLLAKNAKPVGIGMQWNTSNDIISGNAGIGLFLLYVDDLFHDGDSRTLAVRAGSRLLDLAIADNGGSKWTTDPASKRVAPNFARGIAGISYFLARLYTKTNDKLFLAGAQSGATYLQAIAKTDGDGFLLPYELPDNPDLYPLGWDDGPAGTARLFGELAQATGDEAWMAWVKKSANGILTSGIPDKRTPGFWNNVSQSSGSAGVAQFFLDLYDVTKDPRYFDFAKRMTDDLMARATRDDRGTRWAQAENRAEPGNVIAQTGYLQGAAGIGIWLLRLDGAQKGRAPFIHFPDSPWR
jgi:lantibiotic modifying enzyme